MMLERIRTLDELNSVFELTSLVPYFFAVREAVIAFRKGNIEGISLFSTMWWTVYLVWASWYLLQLDQSISAGANVIMCVCSGVIVVIIIVHRRKQLKDRT